MKSVIAFACLLIVAYGLPQRVDKDCPCQDYDKCSTIGDHFVCTCPSGDKYLLGADFDCTLPQLNPCTEDPCGNKAVCVAAQGKFFIMSTEFDKKNSDRSPKIAVKKNPNFLEILGTKIVQF